MLLQEESDLASGRTALYICPIDGDPQCNTVACRITMSDDIVQWSDFAWDGSNLDDEAYPEEADEFEEVAGLKDVTFDRSQYEAVLLAELTRLG